MKSLSLGLIVVSGLACAHTGGRAPVPTAKPVLPLPAMQLGGAKVPVFPLNNVTIEPGTGWDSLVASRGEVKHKVDSILFAIAKREAPEVIWLDADAVRRTVAQAPGMLTPPDQLSTAQLKTHALTTIPEPLRAQLRQLTAVASGGRYILVPVALNFVWDPAHNRASADITIVLADVRLGAVSWSDTMRGFGVTPWDAVALAVRLMFP